MLNLGLFGVGIAFWTALSIVVLPWACRNVGWYNKKWRVAITAASLLFQQFICLAPCWRFKASTKHASLT